MYVYRITNLRNGKIYIGVTKCSIAKRWREHRSGAKRGVTGLLYDAMRKHGTEGFRIEVVYEASSLEEMLMVERGLIAQYGTINRKIGYNLTGGGERGLAPHARRTKSKLLTADAIRFIRNPALADVVNGEMVELLPAKFGVRVARDTLRDVRRGDTAKWMNDECPPIKIGQGGRVTILRRQSSQVRGDGLRKYWANPAHRQQQSVRMKGKPKVRHHA
jgi:hypothetical protein